MLPLGNPCRLLFLDEILEERPRTERGEEAEEERDGVAAAKLGSALSASLTRACSLSRGVKGLTAQAEGQIRSEPKTTGYGCPKA
ncbi:hypothetical protein EK904_013341 [Melospiza melodia maxima]|nr:hypothetical protein EK904_013341 [Melospiza melodia maxima]